MDAAPPNFHEWDKTILTGKNKCASQHLVDELSDSDDNKFLDDSGNESNALDIGDVNSAITLNAEWSSKQICDFFS